MTPSAIDEEAVLSVLETRRDAINDALETELPADEPEQLYAASRYLLEAGGKRLRPAMLLLAAEALLDVEPGSHSYRSFPTLEGDTIDIMKAAVSIEVIQSFTLIHDDIMDDDDLRRGVPAVHAEFDLETAILAGDTLYSKAFEIMLESGAPPERTIEAIQLLARTCTRICEGQSLDIAYEDDYDVSIDAYRSMIERKTAVLFRAAAALPGILLGASDEEVDALKAYGLSVGEAFQIHDDVLDLSTPSETLGKQRGSDLLEGKQTLITIHAAQSGLSPAAIQPADDSPAAIDEAVAALESSGSISFAQETATELVDDGVTELATLPDSEASDLLTSLARYLVHREY